MFRLLVFFVLHACCLADDIQPHVKLSARLQCEDCKGMVPYYAGTNMFNIRVTATVAMAAENSEFLLSCSLMLKSKSSKTETLHREVLSQRLDVAPQQNVAREHDFKFSVYFNREERDDFTGDTQCSAKLYYGPKDGQTQQLVEAQTMPQKWVFGYVEKGSVPVPSTLPTAAITTAHVQQEWSYSGENGPSSWGYDCQKNSQSPIDIQPNTLTLEEKLLAPQFLTGYDSSLSGTLMNNGHSVDLSLPEGIELSLPTVAGKFRADSLHFHWGTNDTKGSEHLVSSRHYSMEMHIVHVNTKYTSMEEALSHSDGLAVLAFFLHEDGNDNSAFTTITDNLQSIANKGNTKVVDNIVLEDLMLNQTDLGSYYRYKGSLTTPPCSEAVTWTVFSKPLDIGSNQVEMFRTKIHLDDHMDNNFRPAQPLKGRRVYTGNLALKGGSAS